MTSLKVNIPNKAYAVTVGGGILGEAAKLFDLDRKILVLTDSGVPREYSEKIAACCREAQIVTVPMGEGSKSLTVLEGVLEKMAEMEMSRSDAVVTVGGGVVGDLGGFAAAVYMRGIDFYNVPTTLLSHVDASVGGKTAVNLGALKNTVGAFHQPRGVLIDTDTLKTLDERLFAEGLAEAIKVSLTSDEELFLALEKMSLAEIKENIADIIYRALAVKKAVVEADEWEGGLRKVLNFGHTLGHAVEALEKEKGIYHGECVAIGMTYMCSPSVKARLKAVLKKVGLPYEYEGDGAKMAEIAMHDKKRLGDKIEAVWVDKIGNFRIVSLDRDGLEKYAGAKG